jgi:hypothetical protein
LRFGGDTRVLAITLDRKDVPVGILEPGDLATAGARRAGLDSVLVETGILAKASEVERLGMMRDLGASPTFTMPAFRTAAGPH